MTVLEFLKNYPEFKIGDYVVLEGSHGRIVCIINQLPLFDIKDKDNYSSVLPENADFKSVTMTGYRIMRECNNHLVEQTLGFFRLDTELFDNNKHKDLLVKKERLDLVIRLNKLN
jgi:hypothetical protein